MTLIERLVMTVSREKASRSVFAPTALLAAAMLHGMTADARAQLARLVELSRSRYVPAIYMAQVYL